MSANIVSGQKTEHKIQGVNLVSPEYSAEYGQIESVKRIHSNWIAITPFLFLEENSPIIDFRSERIWIGDTKEGLSRTIEEAQNAGLNILMKPHFIMGDSSWVGKFDLEDKIWKQWSLNYSAYLLDLAVLCEKYNVNMICIGTEFKILVVKHPEFWLSLISDIRSVYSGELTYAANWDNYENIVFWDQLDFIGIDAYFPITSSVNPSVKNLVKKWEKLALELGNYSNSMKKKIVFTEYGYRSTTQTSWEQWRIESRPSHIKVDLKEQINAYQALYESIWNLDWFAGGFIWKWHSDDMNSGGEAHSNYSPQHKPVEMIIRKYYAK